MRDVTREELRAGVLGAAVIEVLGEEEYDWAHLPGARNIPIRRLDERAHTLDRTRPVITYCNDFL